MVKLESIIALPGTPRGRFLDVAKARWLRFVKPIKQEAISVSKPTTAGCRRRGKTGRRLRGGNATASRRSPSFSSYD